MSPRQPKATILPSGDKSGCDGRRISSTARATPTGATMNSNANTNRRRRAGRMARISGANQGCEASRLPELPARFLLGLLGRIGRRTVGGLFFLLFLAGRVEG